MRYQKLFIKPASTEDFEFYYSLKCEPESIYWSGFKNAPDKSKLYTWYMQKVASHNNKDGYKLYTIFMLKGEMIVRVGSISICLLEDSNNCCEMGIGISTAFAGQGIGIKAIKLAVEECKKHDYKAVFAYIREDNVRSQAAFKKAGFELTEKMKTVFIDNLNCNVNMYAYMCQEKK